MEVVLEIEPDKTNKQVHEEWKKKSSLALHAIQLSCGLALFSKFKDPYLSAQDAWTHLAKRASGKAQQLVPVLDYVKENPIEDNGSGEYLDYKSLYKAIEEGNLNHTEVFLQQKPDAIRARVTLHDDTALHIAILFGKIAIAEKLVDLMNADDLQKINDHGATALSLAAICE
ncbi:uncharacterized protein LOC111370863 [Olea europaea var. sylvestris]|uniref:uncharacterized protein LOC111370863 n=1 Tax=Olea europaea var. sylvestris TaxID=158386 RepID=UPI000C1D372C|nr:uncharacterized protein LOC111370863 [Olea europaea var. sylvestris]